MERSPDTSQTRNFHVAHPATVAVTVQQAYDYRMNNPATDVRLRTRSMPYGVAVTITNRGRILTAYKGASANPAGMDYWQGVRTLAFPQADGRINLVVPLSGLPYGGFTTEVQSWKPMSLHLATGECLKWMSDGRARGEPGGQHRPGSTPGRCIAAALAGEESRT